MIDAEAVAAAVSRCPSVAGLSTGPGVEVVTYLRHHRIPGVRLVEGRVEVHVVARLGPSLPGVADEVRRLVSGLVGGRPVDVVVEAVAG